MAEQAFASGEQVRQLITDVIAKRFYRLQV